ncbi:MAG: SRPBCC family protein [Solirubrobacteraceae bacterium]
MARVLVKHHFALPPSRVFAYLAEHENLEPVFGAKIRRVKDGDVERNGVGSVRELKIGPLPPFEETVTEFVTDSLIRYRITKGSPLKDHEGLLRFSPEGSGTHLRYEINFGAVVPGLDRLIAAGLKRNVAKGLHQVDRAA